MYRLSRPMCLISSFISIGILMSCAGTSRVNTAGTVGDTDRFEGLFAHPSVGILQIREDGRIYRGTFMGDTGPYPFEAAEVDGQLRGTVTYGGRARQLVMVETPQGMLLSIDGLEGDAPLTRYNDLATYERWLTNRGGYSTDLRYEPPKH